MTFSPVELRVYPGTLSRAGDPQVLEALAVRRYTRAPPFLGVFDYQKCKGLDLQGALRAVPAVLQEEVQRLAALVPDQHFNTVFFQRYSFGARVKAHRDPKNNLGHTVIGLYGRGWVTELGLAVGAYVHRPGVLGVGWSTVFEAAGTALQQRPGDVFVLPCTIHGRQGPEHSVRWDLSASVPDSVRYAIILNTIE